MERLFSRRELTQNDDNKTKRDIVQLKGERNEQHVGGFHQFRLLCYVSLQRNSTHTRTASVSFLFKRKGSIQKFVSLQATK